MDDLIGAVGKGVQPPDGTTERDAARYRWLRGQYDRPGVFERVMLSKSVDGESWVGLGVLDGRIDAAMSEAAEPSMSTTSPPDGSLPSEPSASDGGAAAMPQQPSAWVSVADRLPPDHRPVLAVWFSQMGTPFQHILSHWWTEDADRKSWRDYEGDGYFGITHWMPLPEPPQEAAAPLCHVSEPDGTKAPAPSIEGGAKP